MREPIYLTSAMDVEELLRAGAPLSLAALDFTRAADALADWLTIKGAMSNQDVTPLLLELVAIAECLRPAVIP